MNDCACSKYRYTKLIASNSLAFSFEDLYAKFYEVTYRVLSQVKTQSKVLVAVLLLWVKFIPKVPNLWNVHIHRLK